jgi:CTP:molybdopterin cytidylyltransferase MocA
MTGVIAGSVDVVMLAAGSGTHGGTDKLLRPSRAGRSWPGR